MPAAGTASEESAVSFFRRPVFRRFLRLLREGLFGLSVILCAAPFFTGVDVFWCLVLALAVFVMSADAGAMLDD